MKPVVEERNIAKLFSVQGKVVLITGAGGLGGYLARGFAENGARVVVTDVVPGRAQGLQEKGFACRSYQLDQTDKAATEAVVQDIVKAEGRIDALINTAAIAPCHPAEEFPEDELRRVIDINLTAAVLTSQAVGRQMIAQQYGKIVNIGSIAGVMCHSYESMPYECTKAAVHQMTKSLACAWGRYNVNVNAIAPNSPLANASIFRSSRFHARVWPHVPRGRFLRHGGISCHRRLQLHQRACAFGGRRLEHRAPGAVQKLMLANAARKVCPAG